MLIKKVTNPRKKININGVLVKDVIAVIEISK